MITKYHSRYYRTKWIYGLLLIGMMMASFPLTFLGLAQGAPLRILGTYTEDFTTTAFEDPIASTTTGWGTGAITNPRDYHITKVGNYSTPFPVRSIAVQGRKVYAALYDPASGLDSFRIFDIANVFDIAPLDMVSAADYLLSTEVDGDVCYVGDADGTPWLGILNVSNPYQISVLGSLAFGADGKITDFEVQGHFLYISIFGTSGYDLTIYDVEDPSSAQSIGGLAFTELLGIEVYGQYAYLALATNGLSLYNISNPYSVTLIGSVNTPGNATDVIVDGDLAYIADGPSGVQILDVSDTTSPNIVGSYNTPGNAQRLALQGNTLFVADRTGGIQILDVSDPTNPSHVDSITGITAYDVALYGEHIVIGTNEGIDIYLVGSIATDLPLVGNYNAYEAWDVAVQGDIAYVAAGPDGLVTLDVSDPANPTLIAQYSHASPVNYIAIDVQGPYCYLLDTSSASGSRGLWAVDITDPASPVFRSRRHFSQGYGLCVDGDVACIADGTFGMMLVNISNPFNIDITITQVTDGYNYTAVTKQGHFIYAAATDASTSTDLGLYTYDATDLSNLQLTSHSPLSYVEGLDVDGDFCALADGIYGTYLKNTTDPWSLAPTLDFYSPTGTNSTYDVAIFGSYILSAERQGGLYLLSAVDPYNLQLEAYYIAAGMDALRLTIHGDFAYLANRNSLLIFRILRSAADTYATMCFAQSVTVDTTANFIGTATLTYTGETPYGTAISWFISADGGSHWDPCPPAIAHTINYTGSDLRWSAVLSSDHDHHTASITSVSISYTEFVPPMPIPWLLIIAGVAIIAVVVIVLSVILCRRRKKITGT